MCTSVSDDTADSGATPFVRKKTQPLTRAQPTFLEVVTRVFPTQ